MTTGGLVAPTDGMLWCSATQYRVNPSRSAVCARRTVAASASAVVWSVRTGTRSRTESRMRWSTPPARRTFPAGNRRHPLRRHKDVVQHHGGQLAGEGVLLTGVVATQQHNLAVGGKQGRGGGVAELRLRPRHLATGGTDH